MAGGVSKRRSWRSISHEKNQTSASATGGSAVISSMWRRRKYRGNDIAQPINQLHGSGGISNDNALAARNKYQQRNMTNSQRIGAYRHQHRAASAQ